MLDLNEEILRKLNSVESLPENGLRRNSEFFNLIANTNCLIGAVLSNNISAIEVLCYREKIYISEMRENHDHEYLDLCEDFLTKIENVVHLK